jgi:hypothetical protein
LTKKYFIIEQLQNDLRQTEVIFREKVNSELTQVRQGFDQQIKQLEEKLKVSLQDQHLSKNTISQRDAFISQLQARITTIESTVIDISAFKKQALEINEGLQIVQQNFYESLDIIQKHYHVINNSLQIIVDKEKESITARSKFQELIVWKQNLNIPGFVPFSEIEQLKGEMALKSWENNLEESKRLAKEEKTACLNALLAVDVEMKEIDLDDVHSSIGIVEVEKRKENLKKNKERNAKYYIASQSC